MTSTGRFSNRVADYVSGRPGYPDAVVPWLVTTCGLEPSSSIADVGAGTGISAALFLRHGFSVVAVEPNEAMRDSAVLALGNQARFRAVGAPAEATTLPAASVDAVVAAQAFHWFDRAAFRAECARILRPRGIVALLWNVRRVDGSAFAADYETLLRTYGTDYLTVRHENVTDEELADFFGGSFARSVFDNVQLLDRDGLRARLLSSSYVPAAGQDRHEPMLDALDELYRAHQRDGIVRMEYELRAYASQLTSPGAPVPTGSTPSNAS
jgi:SAM-dependent methyltransferase